MYARFAAISIALMMAGAEAPPDPASNPIAAFLHAADVNDVPAMQALLDRGSASFLKRIGNCYLRRVYANESQHELIAAWMCAEGANRSRVLLADLALTKAGKVEVAVQSDNTNNRPAPERTGSALAPD